MRTIWDKYKTADESIICMVGIITLCVSLCKADGKFTDDELIEILKLFLNAWPETPLIIEKEKDEPINDVDDGYPLDDGSFYNYNTTEKVKGTYSNSLLLKIIK